MPIRFLDAGEVAALLGVPTQTIHARRTRGTMLEPDAVIGDRPGWLPESIERWTDAPRPRSRHQK